VDLAEMGERSADPGAVRAALDRLDDDTVDRLASSPAVAEAVVTVVAASRSATRLIETDAAALDVLTELDAPAPADVADAAGPDELVRAKRLAQLRITARDLMGRDTLEQTTAALADLAAAVLAAAVRLAGVDGMAVIGMGKLGRR
jgi:glutamine synthetase adenylyltransferase